MGNSQDNIEATERAEKQMMRSMLEVAFGHLERRVASIGRVMPPATVVGVIKESVEANGVEWSIAMMLEAARDALVEEVKGMRASMLSASDDWFLGEDPGKVRLIVIDAEKREVRFEMVPADKTLEAMQSVVGGNIEPVVSMQVSADLTDEVYCNEEANIGGVPDSVGGFRFNDMKLRGSAVVAGLNHTDGSTVGVAGFATWWARNIAWLDPEDFDGSQQPSIRVSSDQLTN